MEDRFSVAPETCDFWHRWYNGHLNGAPISFELQRQIALIDPEDWDLSEENDTWAKVAAHVAALIREIEADHAFRAARIGEALVLDQDQMVFSAVPVTAHNADRVARHLSRVEDALDDLISLGGNNGVTRDSPEFRIVARLVQRYADDPERIAFDLTDLGRSITRQVEAQE